MNPDTKILVVADYDSIKSMLREALSLYGNVQFTSSREVKKEIDRIAPDVVLIVQPEDGSGVELVQYIQGELLEGLVIFLTERQDFGLLRDIVRAGAIEYIVMPDELALLTDRLEKIAELGEQQQRKKGRLAPAKRLCAEEEKCTPFTVEKAEVDARSWQPGLRRRSSWNRLHAFC